MVHKLTITEAMLGYKFALPYLDGTTHIIESAPGETVRPGDVVTVPGLGMPLMATPYKTGNLFIYFDVEFPDVLNLTPE
jgi:DnaJ-class molecular chaperone